MWAQNPQGGFPLPAPCKPSLDFAAAGVCSSPSFRKALPQALRTPVACIEVKRVWNAEMTVSRG